MLLSCSTTNIVSFIICTYVYLFYEKKGKFFLALLILITIYIIIYIGLENTDFVFIMDRINSGSKDYSLETILFAITPRTILGSNFMNNSYLNDGLLNRRDVGYIPFFLNLIFVTYLVYVTLRLIISHDRFIKLIGISVLYFLLHSTKVAMVTYSLSMLIFVIFIVSARGYYQKIKTYGVR